MAIPSQIVPWLWSIGHQSHTSNGMVLIRTRKEINLRCCCDAFLSQTDSRLPARTETFLISTSDLIVDSAHLSLIGLGSYDKSISLISQHRLINGYDKSGCYPPWLWNGKSRILRLHPVSLAFFTSPLPQERSKF